MYETFLLFFCLQRTVPKDNVRSSLEPVGAIDRHGHLRAWPDEPLVHALLGVRFKVPVVRREHDVALPRAHWHDHLGAGLTWIFSKLAKKNIRTTPLKLQQSIALITK